MRTKQSAWVVLNVLCSFWIKGRTKRSVWIFIKHHMVVFLIDQFNCSVFYRLFGLKSWKIENMNPPQGPTLKTAAANLNELQSLCWNMTENAKNFIDCKKKCLEQILRYYKIISILVPWLNNFTEMNKNKINTHLVNKNKWTRSSVNENNVVVVFI